MEENLPAKTGKSLAEWKAVLAKTDLDKHREMINYLKSEFGLTYGFANFIAMKYREADAGSHDADDLVDSQYSKGKEHLRPIYDLLVKHIESFGDDAELAPKKAYVSARRKKQFAILQPSTKTRFDLGLNLKGKSAEGKLEAAGSWNAMCSHRIKINAEEEVDEQTVSWLREAYEAAG